MFDISQEINEQAIANDEKRRLSDDGMAMDQEEILAGAREDGHEGSAVDAGN